MTNKLIFRGLLACSLTLAIAAGAAAQSDQGTNPAVAARTKPAPKSHKVWTNDEVGTLRTLEDEHIEAAQRQKERADEAAKQIAAANATSAETQVKPQEKPALPSKFANAKTATEIGDVIAWEERDIASEQDYLVKIKKELDEAPPADRERLTKLLADKTRVLASTKEELKTFEEKKKSLEKPVIASGDSQSLPVQSSTAPNPQQ